MIRIATEEDLIQVEQIYNEILEYESQTISYTNWRKGLYPTIENARQALEHGTLFVGEDDNSIYGCVILNQIQPKEYSNIEWKIKADSSEVMVIHTLCIRPSVHSKGKGKIMVDFCENYAQKLKLKVIRLDTYEGNIPASALYTKLRFSYAGITRFHFQNVIWENLKCFEKAL